MPSPSYFLVAGAQRRELESALATVWDALEREVNGLNNLRLATRILVEELGMAPTDDVGQLVTQLIQGVDGAREGVKEALLHGVQRALAVTCSHYSNITLDELSQGFPVGYTDAELDEIEGEVMPFARTLAEKMQEDIARD